MATVLENPLHHCRLASPECLGTPSSLASLTPFRVPGIFTGLQTALSSLRSKVFGRLVEVLSP